MGIKSWLQLFRAQTAPATLLLLLTPYLTNAPFFDAKNLVLAASFILFHYFSFGHNSLMDTAMMYDQRDPSKKHHPLISGAIKLHVAHNVIQWGLSLLTMAAGVITLLWSPNPAWALICLLAWVAFGHAYNDGLSKESIVGFMAISLACTLGAVWGWFLSHRGLNPVGVIYFCYVFLIILYQISWSGFIKEIQIRERSNILTKMGAFLDITWKGEKTFKPGKARFYAYFTKGITLFFGWLLWWLRPNLVTLVWLVILTLAISFYTYKTTRERIYIRDKEIFNMGIMEILTIYLPLPLLLDLTTAFILMVIGVIYYFTMNKILWQASFPRV